MTTAPLELAAGDTRLAVDLARGGRIAALAIAGIDVILREDDRERIGDPALAWGSYPMAPWAGRIREGRFTFAGRTHQLPANFPPHAIHGVVFDRPWMPTGPNEIAVELDERWPFRGRVRQRFVLEADRLIIELELEADEPMPAVVGWHPWFPRILTAPDGRRSPDVRLELAAGAMLERGPDWLPTGRRVPPRDGAWDDTFVDVAEPPRLTWPGWLELTVASSLDHWVVFTERSHALCVEPQSGPPNGLDDAPVVLPGEPFHAILSLHWRLLADAVARYRAATSCAVVAGR